jgi:thymidine kinase
MDRRPDKGWIEVICGPMFSGKSEELIRRVTRSRIARIPVQTFKPGLDTRFGEGRVTSHSQLSVAAVPVTDSDHLLRVVDDATVVIGIDEGQFFDFGLVEVVDHLASTGRQVIVAGLDTDYLRRPFGPIPALCDRAEYLTKALAVCHRCGGPALYTQRIVHSDELVVLGATGAYEARCRFCYNPEEPEQPSLGLVEEGLNLR